VILSVFDALRPPCGSTVGLASHGAAELASRSAPRNGPRWPAIQADRRDRFALLELEALPLLRGIADGSLDPADEEVRQKCARHATSLRRALVDRARLGRELLAGLEPALSAARQRGLLVEVQCSGSPGGRPGRLAQATLAAVGHGAGRAPAATGHADVLAPPVLGQSRASRPRRAVLIFDQLPPAARAPAFPPLTRSSGWRAELDVDRRHGLPEIGWRPVMPV